jgi:hypothetical protein
VGLTVFLLARLALTTFVTVILGFLTGIRSIAPSGITIVFMPLLDKGVFVRGALIAMIWGCDRIELMGLGFNFPTTEVVLGASSSTVDRFLLGWSMTITIFLACLALQSSFGN